MSVLVDTSVWVDYLRRAGTGRADELDHLLDAEHVVMCGPVLAELVAGLSESDEVRVRPRLEALPWVALSLGAWSRVGEVSRTMRSSGTPVALTDIEIAVAAVEAGADLWSFDADFERLAQAVPDLILYAP